MKELETLVTKHGGALLKTYAANTAAPLLLLDSDMRLLDCNPAFLRLTGRKELPAGERLAALLSGPAAPLPAAAPVARARLNFSDGLGGTQSLDCLLLGAAGATLVIGERSMLLQSGAVTSMSAINDELVNATRELQKNKAALEAALAKVKTLEGMLPICASCKKILDEKGAWQPVEKYIKARTDAQFSHGLCPDCARRLYPGFAK